MGFARILKDESGRPSGYRGCDGEVCWLPRQESYEHKFRRIKVELGTVRVLNHDFLCDRTRVYRQGILLKGISPEGFRVINAVFTGNHQVIYTPLGDAKVAYPESFEALDSGGIPENGYFPVSYGRDEEFVYFYDGSTDTRHAIRVRGCQDPASFVSFGDGNGRDSRRQFSYGRVKQGS